MIFWFFVFNWEKSLKALFSFGIYYGTIRRQGWTKAEVADGNLSW